MCRRAEIVAFDHVLLPLARAPTCLERLLVYCAQILRRLTEIGLCPDGGGWIRIAPAGTGTLT